ncbi:MAG: AbrB/MazE/SpoVT family DNA-binding domain-containing protein [Myxococcales bacterium]|nr:AbrB/MazE/SpoVT family DNA-binding domain-containing protein [Myxococcales bacterium]
MIKKLTAIGNSYGLVIDRSILELLRITPDSELELSTDGTRLIIEPVRRDERPPRRRTPASPRPGKPTRPGKPRAPEPRYGFPKKPPW